MMQDKMVGEIRKLKLAGYMPKGVREELRERHTEVPTLKTVRKYYNMDRASDDNHAKVRKQMAFDCEPFASAIVEIVSLNPGCCVGSVCDVFVGKFVEGGDYDELLSNEQTVRNFIHRLEEEGRVGAGGEGGISFLDTFPRLVGGRVVL